MKTLLTVAGLLLLLGNAVISAQAQDTAPVSTAEQAGTGERRVPLIEAAQVYDAAGGFALEARLRTTALAATLDAPVRNIQMVVTNRSSFFYNYATGWATFYDASGVRCGAGLWKTVAFTPNESVEVDTPGLRLTCTPATWRVSASNLLTATRDVSQPEQPAAPPQGTNRAASLPRLEININGKTLPLQLGNPLKIVVGRERVQIVVTPAP
ncbi:MAG: hypothetical protein M3371_04705 [Acidobacteriota bacterium]|nr:hypothetical protein [Acidobacteriota bacterium]